MLTHGLISLLSLTALSPSVMISAGDRTELRLRSGASDANVDAITAPRLELSLATYRVRWQLTYTPILTRLNLGSPDSATLLIHTGSLRTDIVLSRRTLLSFSESASYGTQNFRVMSLDAAGATEGNSPNPATAPGPGAAAPNVPLAAEAGRTDSTVRFGSVLGAATLSHQFHPRWRGTAMVSALARGGLDAASESAVRKSKQGAGMLSLSHVLTPSDGLTVQFEGQVAKTDPGLLAQIVSGEATWARRFSQTLVGSLSAGGAYASVKLPNGDVLSRAMPTAGGSIGLIGSYKGWRSSLTLSEEFSPFIDRFRGTVSQRALTTLTARATKNRVTLMASGYGTASTSSVGETSLLYAYGVTEALIYRLDRHWSLELGSRQTWFRYRNIPDQPMLWAVYSAITYTTGNWPL